MENCLVGNPTLEPAMTHRRFLALECLRPCRTECLNQTIISGPQIISASALCGSGQGAEQ
jgi:hypothetical protein